MSLHNIQLWTTARMFADYGNLAYRWYVITVLEEYDYERGGHLILWNLELVIEFSPECTIMVPLSVIYHSNTKIQTNDWCYLFMRNYHSS